MPLTTRPSLTSRQGMTRTLNMRRCLRRPRRDAQARWAAAIRDLVPRCRRGYLSPSGGTMFGAAARALSQMLSPPFRSVLMQSVGVAVLVLIVLTIVLGDVFRWVPEAGPAWAAPGV